MARTGIDPALRRKLAQGEYVVDPQAVAEAILRRAGAARREGSRMLVPAELLHRPPVDPHEDSATAGADPA